MEIKISPALIKAKVKGEDRLVVGLLDQIENESVLCIRTAEGMKKVLKDKVESWEEVNLDLSKAIPPSKLEDQLNEESLAVVNEMMIDDTSSEILSSKNYITTVVSKTAQGNLYAVNTTDKSLLLNESGLGMTSFGDSFVIYYLSPYVVRLLHFR